MAVSLGWSRALQRNEALRGRFQAADDPKQSRLAAAVRAHDGVERTRLDDEVEVAEDRSGGRVFEAQALDLDSHPRPPILCTPKKKGRLAYIVLDISYTICPQGVFGGAGNDSGG